MLLRVADEILHEFFRELHIAVDIAERHLGFDHPEFGGVTRGVGIFGAKRRAERIDVGERGRKNLRLELAADGEEGFLAEEILRGVDLAILRHRRMREIEGRHAKHVPGALGVARRDNRGVDVDEVFVLKKLVDGEREPRAHAEDGTEQIRPRPQMRDFAEKFQRVAFFLERVGGVGLAENRERRGDDFPFLALAF